QLISTPPKEMRGTIEARRDDVMHYRGGECKVRNVGSQGFFRLWAEGPRLGASACLAQLKAAANWKDRDLHFHDLRGTAVTKFYIPRSCDRTGDGLGGRDGREEHPAVRRPAGGNQGPKNSTRPKVNTGCKTGCKTLPLLY